MEHDLDPAIFEQDPHPAMRRASAALAAACAHATDAEVRDLLARAASFVERAQRRQLALDHHADGLAPPLPFPAERATRLRGTPRRSRRTE